MNKSFLASLLKEVIKTACVAITGVTMAAIADIVFNEVIEKTKNPMGFILK